MSEFTRWSAPLDLRYYHEKVWMVITPFKYDVAYLGSGISVEVPDGFITDLASVPKAVWNVISPMEERIGQASVMHDWLCRHQELIYLQDSGEKTKVKVSRQRCDEVFDEALAVVGTTKWKHKLIMDSVNAYRVLKRLK